MKLDSIEEIRNYAAYKGYIIPLSRYLHNEKITTLEINHQLLINNFLNEAENGDNYKVELHPDTIAIYLEPIKSLTKKKHYLSAAILTSVALEEQINGLMRVGCSAKGYEHKSITKYIKETALKTKIELILPLLGINVHEAHKNTIYQFLPLRNSAIHGKAIPSFHSKEETLDSAEENEEKAKQLILQYPITKIQRYIEESEKALTNIPELLLAHEILTKRLSENT